MGKSGTKSTRARSQENQINAPAHRLAPPGSSTPKSKPLRTAKEQKVIKDVVASNRGVSKASPNKAKAKKEQQAESARRSVYQSESQVRRAPEKSPSKGYRTSETRAIAKKGVMKTASRRRGRA